MAGTLDRVRPAQVATAPTQSWVDRSLGRTALCLTIACGLALAAESAAGQATERGDRSKPLEGRWHVLLLLDSTSLPGTPTRETAGEVAFGTSAWWGNADRFGRHSVDLRPFFGRVFSPPANVPAFGAADTSFLSEASGGVSGDSVAIDFIPRIDHGGVSLRGRFLGDSARGRWYRRGRDGAGRFVLRRLSGDPVAVAPIPEPVRKSTAVATAVPKTPTTAASRRELAIAAKAARDSARAVTLAAAKAKRDSARVVTLAAAAAATAKRDSARVATLAAAAAAEAKRDSTRAATLAATKEATARRDSARAATLALAKARRDSARSATLAAAAAAKSRRDSVRAATLAASTAARSRRDSVRTLALAAAQASKKPARTAPGSERTVARAAAATGGATAADTKSPSPATPATAPPSAPASRAEAPTPAPASRVAVSAPPPDSAAKRSASEPPELASTYIVVLPASAAATSAAQSRAPDRPAAPAPAREPARPPETVSPTMGSLRVRTWDQATKQWFVTPFELRRPDGRLLLLGTMRSGPPPDGWGPVVRRAPGRYEVVIEKFVCGDKYWLLRKEIVRPVDLAVGAMSDLTIELDLSAEPAKPSIDNKTGARCTAGPGTPR